MCESLVLSVMEQDTRASDLGGMLQAVNTKTLIFAVFEQLCPQHQILKLQVFYINSQN
jgi:hypothetical protein